MRDLGILRRKMDLGTTHYSWTLGGLAGSFVDLVVAYFLLCGSALAFLSSKVCNVFGTCLPCPCCGVFGYRNRNLCLHKVFVESPVRIVCSVQMMTRSRYPFSPFVYKDRASNSNMNLLGDGECSKEDLEASRGSLGGMLSGNSGYIENGYESYESDRDHDLKRMRCGGRKLRSGGRVRRRALEFEKFSPVPSYGDSWPSYGDSWPVGEDPRVFPFNESDTTKEMNQSIDEEEDNLQGDVFSPTSIDLSERSWFSIEETEDVVGDSIASYYSRNEGNLGLLGNEAARIRVLEEALKQERAASAAMRLELEKERAAAASATEEAMAMMLRLQTDKALLEMEAKQSKRMVEEKFAHDEDEKSILMDIIVRMETENHFLEKELETYKHMSMKKPDETVTCVARDLFGDS